MSDVTTEPRTCTICKQAKPLTDFYLQHTGKPNPVCIPCHLKRAKAYPKKSRTESAITHEQICMEYMRALGIHTVPGKSSEFVWVDLVSWGFIRVETKLGLDIGGGNWSFKFSDAQVKRRLLADVIVLILPREKWEYYVFEANHPVFYKGGRLKFGLSYIEHPHHRKFRADAIPMTPEMMNAARDDWTILLDKMPDLKAIRNRVVETAIDNMNIKQLKMF